MGGVTIHVVVQGGAGDLMGEVNASLQDLVDNAEDRLKILRHPGACEMCVANTDPLAIPVHEDCHCSVEEIHETVHHPEDA